MLGDLTTADRVAVLVPGVDTTLRRLRPRARRRGPAGARRPGAAPCTSSCSKRRPRDVAVVAWLGYDPPEGSGLAAATEGRARAGAAALTAFVAGRAAAAPGAAVTLIGHSYGAIVVGLAAPRLPEVADLVALGAPGMGADRAAELGGARVWSGARRRPTGSAGSRRCGCSAWGYGRRPSTPGVRRDRAADRAGWPATTTTWRRAAATLRAVTDVVLSGGPRHESASRVF